MFTDFLLEAFRAAGDKPALIFRDQPFTYRQLLAGIDDDRKSIERQGIGAGSVVLLKADYSPQALSMLLAMIEAGCIIISVSNSSPTQIDEIHEIGLPQFVVTIEPNGKTSIARTSSTGEHELYGELRNRKHPGLVLFSSGSTGKSKGTVHDFVHLLGKYRKQRHDLRTIAFLLFDHIGGLDTLFYCLSNGSTIVVVQDRAPEAVCTAIEKHKVEVLPTAPTFLSLLILSEAFKRFDLSSIKYITYGAEVMPQGTLSRIKEIFPNATILQKYGTTEIGTMRSKSKSDDSLWVKIGGEGYQHRIVDGMLQIKADSAMLGYLNAPSPFTDDGYFQTGDCVEVDGEYIRILGRTSDIINVGGQKVYPAEVESVIREMSNVDDVTVFGQKNPLLGNIVVARVQLREPELEAAFRVRLKKHVGAKLEGYKVPVKLEFSDKGQANERFKKVRRQSPEDPSVGGEA